MATVMCLSHTWEYWQKKVFAVFQYAQMLLEYGFGIVTQMWPGRWTAVGKTTLYMKSLQENTSVHSSK